MKILAIDDNPDNLTTLKAVLRDALPGCALWTALNGPEGIELARAEDPDVILLDIVMPGIDGFEVCRRLKADERLRSIPVVFLTALQTDRESRIKALEAGAEAFLSKPLGEQELTAQVRAMAKIKAANRVQRLEKEHLAALVVERTLELETELAAHKRAEAALRETRAILDAALNQSQAGIAIADAPSGLLRYVNDAGLLIGGGDRQTLVNGVGIAQYVARWQILDFDGRPLKPDEVPLTRAIKFGETCNREFIIRRALGDDRVVLANAAPIRDDTGKVVAAIVVFIDTTERKRTEEALVEKVEELRQAIEQIKTLRGILPICSSCKKIRDDQGYWNQVEVYVRNHTEAEFSHSFCPECLVKLYPDFGPDAAASAPQSTGGPP